MRNFDYFPFGCGDQVKEPEGRHVGTVEAVDSNNVRVRWNDSRWLSYYRDGVGIVKASREDM